MDKKEICGEPLTGFALLLSSVQVVIGVKSFNNKKAQKSRNSRMACPAGLEQKVMIPTQLKLFNCLAMSSFRVSSIILRNKIWPR